MEIKNLGNLADKIMGFGGPRGLLKKKYLLIIATLVGCEFQFMITNNLKIIFTTTFI